MIAHPYARRRCGMWLFAFTSRRHSITLNQQVNRILPRNLYVEPTEKA